MKKSRRRLGALLLALAMVLSLTPATALAARVQEEEISIPAPEAAVDEVPAHAPAVEDIDENQKAELLANNITADPISIDGMVAIPTGDYTLSAGDTKDEEGKVGPLKFLTDNVKNTVWVTNWNTLDLAHRWVQISFAADTNCTGLAYYPRVYDWVGDAASNHAGSVLNYKIDISTAETPSSDADWTTIVDTSNGSSNTNGNSAWTSDAGWKYATFPEQTVRHIRLWGVTTAEDNGSSNAPVDNCFMAGAELRALQPAPELHVQGTITTDGTAGLEGAKVELVQGASTGYAFVSNGPTATTGSDGAYTLNVGSVGAGDYYLRVSKPGHGARIDKDNVITITATPEVTAGGENHDVTLPPIETADNPAKYSWDFDTADTQPASDALEKGTGVGENGVTYEAYIDGDTANKGMKISWSSGVRSANSVNIKHTNAKTCVMEFDAKRNAGNDTRFGLALRVHGDRTKDGQYWVYLGQLNNTEWGAEIFKTTTVNGTTSSQSGGWSDAVNGTGNVSMPTFKAGETRHFKATLAEGRIAFEIDGVTIFNKEITSMNDFCSNQGWGSTTFDPAVVDAAGDVGFLWGVADGSLDNVSNSVFIDNLYVFRNDPSFAVTLAENAPAGTTAKYTENDIDYPITSGSTKVLEGNLVTITATAQEGKVLTLTVTPDDSAHTAEVTQVDDHTCTFNMPKSAVTVTPVFKSTFTAAISETNGLKVGKELSVTTTPEATATYQWYRIDGSADPVAIDGATAATYTPVAADEGKTLKVIATGTGDFIGTAEATTTATIAAADVQVTGVTLDTATKTLFTATGDSDHTVELTATVEPSGATSPTYAWASSADSVASVVMNADDNTKATVTGLTNGTANITVTVTSADSTTKAATCAITVQTKVESVSLDKTTATIFTDAGDTNHTVQLTATVAPDGASNKDVTWESSDTNVATVANGLVTAVGNGTATITVKSSEDSTKVATCAVTVKTKVTGVTISATGGVRVGDTLTATAKAGETEVTDVTYQWKRGNDNIDGETSQTYEVTADDIGQAITVTVSGTGNYAGDATSAPVTPAKTTIQGKPTITGAAKFGETLTAVVTDVTPEGARNGLTYQWYRGEEAITDAITSTYKLAQADIGSAIKVKVTAAENSIYTGSVTSDATAAVAKADAPAAPSVTINYAAEELTFTQDGAYTVTVDSTPEDVSVSAGAKTVAIKDGWFGKTLSIALKETDTTLAGAAASLDVPARPGAPALTVNTSDESVTISSDYSYNTTSAAYTETWTLGTGVAVKVAAEGKIYIYKNATGSAFKSEVQTLEAPAKAATPNVTIDYEAETLNTTADIQYQVDGGAWTACTANMKATAFGWDGTGAVTVKFRTPAGDQYVSDEQSVTIPKRPDAPSSLTATAPTGTGTDNGKIENVTTAMEYKVGSEGTWTPVSGTEITNLAGDAKVFVRVKATNAAFASTATEVHVPHYTEPGKTAAPTFQSTMATFADRAATTVTFTLTNGPVDTYKVYTAKADGTEAEGVAASVSGSTLTLTFTPKPTVDTKYYISATDTTNSTTESLRTEVTVKVYKSNDATLRTLSLDGVTLNETFVPATITYTATVENSVSSVTVTAAKSEEHASVKVGETAYTAPVTVDLNAADNDAATTTAITITVTAEDGTTEKVYTVTVTRKGTLAAAKAAVEGATYGPVTQAACADKVAAKTVVENVIHGLSLNGAAATVTEVSYTAPIAGADGTPNGTNGTYKFKVALSKTGCTDAETTELTLTITATAYEAPKTVSGVTVDGAAQVDQTLTANVTLSEGTADSTNVTYQWQRKGDTDSDWADIAAANASTYRITTADVGKTIRVVVTGKGDYTGTKESDPTAAVPKLANADAPTGLAASNCTTAANTDGKITGLDAAKTYDYKKSDAADWTPVPANATEIANLTPGTYYVRFAATDTHEAGANYATVTIMGYNVVAYTVTVNPTANGTVTPSATQAAEGTQITLTIAPATNYKLDTLTATPSTVTFSGTDNTRTFNMPAENVTVNATFKIDVAACKTAVETKLDTIPDQLQASCGSEDAAKAVITAAIDALNLPSDVTVAVSGTFTPAQAGTAENENGTDGKYEYTVTLTAGSDTATTEEKTLTITATAYTGGDTPTVSKAALTEAITAANAAKNGVQVIDADPADVTAGVKFVTSQDVIDTLDAAIEAAQAVVDDADADQTAVDNAVTVLNGAVDTFNAAIKTGTKRTTHTGSSSGTTTTTVSKGDDGSVTTTVKNNVTGTVTETVQQPDGTVEVVETKKDGTVTETVTDPEGAKTEKVTDPEKNVTITATDAKGEVLAKVELPAEIPAPETRFDDVPEDHWADKAIQNAAGLGLVNGVGDNRYDMVSSMTRGALATVLHRLSQGKTDYDVTFKDVAQGKYYTEGVAWAAKVDVVKGISEDVFAPDQIITREQLAVMLSRYAKLIGMSVKADAKALDAFSDGSKTNDWAVDGVAWCVENGILQGKGNDILDAGAEVSRAEVAVMLDRFIALMK